MRTHDIFRTGPSGVGVINPVSPSTPCDNLYLSSLSTAVASIKSNKASFQLLEDTDKRNGFCSTLILETNLPPRNVYHEVKMAAKVITLIEASYSLLFRSEAVGRICTRLQAFSTCRHLLSARAGTVILA